MSFEPTDPQASVITVLTEHSYDYAPVRAGGEVVGFLSLANLEPARDGTVESKVSGLTDRVLVTGDTPISQLMGWLQDLRFLFVVEGRDIVGLVTPSDLNKQPGRTYFYLLIAGLEMTLADLIRSHFSSQEHAAEVLPPGRRTLLRQRVADLATADVAADTVAAMDLTDLLTVVKQTPVLLTLASGYSRTTWQRKVCKPIIDLRHDVMHTVRTLATDADTSLERLVRLDRLLHVLTDAYSKPLHP